MKIYDILTKHKWIFYMFIAIVGIFIVSVFYRCPDNSYLYNPEEYTIQNLKKPRKYHNHKIMENRCRKIIEDLFHCPFTSIRPSFLKYPKTGKNLELDMYNNKLKLAFEYQGQQHRKFTPFFHSCYKDFTDQIERDEFKKYKCKELGITLIEIPDTVKNENLENFIKNSVNIN